MESFCYFACFLCLFIFVLWSVDKICVLDRRIREVMTILYRLEKELKAFAVPPED